MLDKLPVQVDLHLLVVFGFRSVFPADSPFCGQLLILRSHAPTGQRPPLTVQLTTDEQRGDDSHDIRWAVLVENFGPVIRTIDQTIITLPAVDEFQQHLPVDRADGQVALAGPERSVEKQRVARPEVALEQGVALHPRVIGVAGVFDEYFVQVDPLARVIRGRGRETCGEAAQHGYRDRCGCIVDFEYFELLLHIST